jgi:CSLREA domain-containing protein
MNQRWKLYALVALGGAVLAACAPSSFTVNSAADTDDGTCSAADCTLREAINAANAAAASPITIQFNIGAGGLHTISPTSPLPAVTKSVVIDGSTQPGFAGSPLIELDGTNAGGSTDGLVLQGGNSTVRGLAINRFGNAGIVLAGSGNNKVAANYLGTDPSGMTGMGNYIGVQVQSASNDIGGVVAADRNVISGNSGPGVALGGTGSVGGNLVEGNYIGLDASGASPLPNEVGVNVGAPGNIIGGKGYPAGSGQSVRNLISGNAADGILILADNTQVLGNSIGVDADNNVALGNGSRGVRIKTGNGSSIQSNFIAFNGSYGVSVENGTGNIIQYNSIHDNGNLGIAIDQGIVIPNDPGDPDTGANNRQNFPQLTAAVSSATDATFSGILNSTLGTAFTVQFFTNPSCDPSGYGEGFQEVKTISVTTDASGNAALTAYFPTTSFAPGTFITATATDPANNTSDFSNCIPVTLGGGTVQGVVYGDLNGNGTIEAGENPLGGVDVQLSGCGPTLTQTTGADGAFSFTGLPAGSCMVQASKSGWAFSGSFPSLGYPIPVASDPTLPTSFSIFMAPAAAAVGGCTNELNVVTEFPLMKAPMAPGQGFTKTWTVLNQGTCTWTDAYHLVFRGGPSAHEGGSQMGAPSSTPLGSLVSVPVLPGQQVTISLGQTAPMQPGWYVGAWGLDGPNGEKTAVYFGGTLDTMSSFYSDIVVPGGTPTPTPASASSGFSPPSASSPIFYYRGNGCGPMSVDLSVGALDPSVRDVVLFFRLKNADGGATTDWNDGVAMSPLGKGMFGLTVASQDIDGFTSFPQAVFQYQFVAEGAGGQIVSRSPVFDDIMLEVCHQ